MAQAGSRPSERCSALLLVICPLRAYSTAFLKVDLAAARSASVILQSLRPMRQRFGRLRNQVARLIKQTKANGDLMVF